MSILDDLAEKNIKDALNRGELSNLPGEGLPLQLEDLSMVPAELRSSYILLKNAGYIPKELELRKEVISLKKLLKTVLIEEKKELITKRLLLIQMQLELAGMNTHFFDEAYREKIENQFKD